MTFLMILPSTMSWGKVKPHETLSKPLLSFFKFEQLCTVKHVQMLSNFVHILKCCNNASRPNGTSWREFYIDQSTPKPSLTRIKFDQVCTANFFSLTPTFVSMFKSSNYETTPSGASRRIDLHD